jgi:hypothetical protein
MRTKDYSTLSYLARAIAVRPDQAQEFIDALRDDVQGATLGLTFSSELTDALAALAEAWRQQKRRRGDEHLSLRDVTTIAILLETEPNEAARLAGSALRSAVRELLLRRRREEGLSEDERALAGDELSSLTV